MANLLRQSVFGVALLLGFATGAAARLITEVMDATGDGGTPLSFPQAVVVDSQGTLYVASGHPTSAVFRVTPGGVPTVFVDETGDGAGSVLHTPSDLALDADDNLYVVAAGSDNVFKVTPAGVVTKIMDATGDGGANPFACAAQCNVAVDGAGVVYVSMQDLAGTPDESRIFRIPPGGPVTVVLDATGGGTGAELSCVFEGCGLAVDSDDNVYVTSPRGDRHVYRIAPGGAVTSLGAPPEVGFPSGAVVDSLGRVVVAGWRGLARWDAGVWTVLLDVDDLGNGRPREVDVDGDDNVYVAAGLSSVVLRVSPDGITTILDVEGDGQGTPFDCTLASHCGGPAVWRTDPPRVYVTGAQSINVLEIASQCPSTPRAGCKRPIAANAAKLQLKDKPGSAKDAVTLKLTKMAATAQGELGTPTTDTDYSVCVYDGASPRLVFEGTAPGGGLCGTTARPCWKAAGSGFGYKDAQGRPDGIKKATLRSGPDGKAKGSLSGSGPFLASTLPFPSLPLTLPVRAQLQVPGGLCWEAEFDTALRNDTGDFSAKGE